jgi:hypothetical protein
MTWQILIAIALPNNLVQGVMLQTASILDCFQNTVLIYHPAGLNGAMNAINVKSPNNISKWHMGFNSAFKGLTYAETKHCSLQ